MRGKAGLRSPFATAFACFKVDVLPPAFRAKTVSLHLSVFEIRHRTTYFKVVVFIWLQVVLSSWHNVARTGRLVKLVSRDGVEPPNRQRALRYPAHRRSTPSGLLVVAHRDCHLR